MIFLISLEKYDLDIWAIRLHYKDTLVGEQMKMTSFISSITCVNRTRGDFIIVILRFL